MPFVRPGVCGLPLMPFVSPQQAVSGPVGALVLGGSCPSCGLVCAARHSCPSCAHLLHQLCFVRARTCSTSLGSSRYTSSTSSSAATHAACRPTSPWASSTCARARMRACVQRTRGALAWDCRASVCEHRGCTLALYYLGMLVLGPNKVPPACSPATIKVTAVCGMCSRATTLQEHTH